MSARSRGPVTYTGRDEGRPAQPVLPSGVMRSRSSIVSFGRLCAASGLGVYLGASVAGLVAVLNGDAFTSGSRWLSTVPVLAVVGAGVGAAVAWLTRRWLLPRAPRRLVTFAVAGVITLPLFSAIGQMRALDSVGAPLALAGGVVMTIVYWRAGSSSTRAVRGPYSGAGTR